MDSVIRETQEKVDDGLERVFVNTAVKDGTTISEYMDCFLQKEIDNAKFPKLTNRVHYLKHEEVRSFSVRLSSDLTSIVFSSSCVTISSGCA